MRDFGIYCKGSWYDNLPFIEFAYNIIYKSRIQMTPFEALYGCRCRSTIGWLKVGKVALVRPDSILEDMKMV